MNVRIEQVGTVQSCMRQQMLDVWRDVTEAGGAVGLFPGATPAEYEKVMLQHEEQMARGAADLYVMLDADDVVGFAWWVRGMFGGPHVATIKRLMVSPARHGEGLGRMLMDHLHSADVLGRLDGVDFLHLQYRVGNGLGGWYATYGYTEIARYDLFRKNSDGTYGGWAEMLRTRDGGPLPVNGAL